jgi:hypothetical protein
MQLFRQENLFKQAMDCKKEVEGFRTEASKAQSLEDRQSLFPGGYPPGMETSIDFGNFDERKKKFEDELDQYETELTAWEEKIWDDFVEHHRCNSINIQALSFAFFLAVSCPDACLCFLVIPNANAEEATC